MTIKLIYLQRVLIERVTNNSINEFLAKKKTHTHKDTKKTPGKIIHMIKCLVYEFSR